MEGGAEGRRTSLSLYTGRAGTQDREAKEASSYWFASTLRRTHLSRASYLYKLHRKIFKREPYALSRNKVKGAPSSSFVVTLYGDASQQARDRWSTQWRLCLPGPRSSEGRPQVPRRRSRSIHGPVHRPSTPRIADLTSLKQTTELSGPE